MEPENTPAEEENHELSFSGSMLILRGVVIAHASKTARHSDSVRPPLKTQPLGLWGLDGRICDPKKYQLLQIPMVFVGLWIVLGVMVGCVGRVGVVVLLNDFIEQSMRR